MSTEERIGKPRRSDFLVFVELRSEWDGRVSHGQCHGKQPQPRGQKAAGEFRCVQLREELMSSHVRLTSGCTDQQRLKGVLNLDFIPKQETRLILDSMHTHTH